MRSHISQLIVQRRKDEEIHIEFGYMVRGFERTHSYVALERRFITARLYVHIVFFYDVGFAFRLELQVGLPSLSLFMFVFGTLCLDSRSLPFTVPSFCTFSSILCKIESSCGLRQLVYQYILYVSVSRETSPLIVNPSLIDNPRVRIISLAPPI